MADETTNEPSDLRKENSERKIQMDQRRAEQSDPTDDTSHLSNKRYWRFSTNPNDR